MPNPAKSLPKNLDLIGNYCRLESLKEAAHGQDLWQFIGSKKDVWTYLMNGPWEKEDDFQNWLKDCQKNSSRTYYAVIDPKLNSALGILCLMDFNLDHASIEIGGIAFSKNLQKTTIASEAVYLLLKHAFEDLGFRRVQWKCNLNNEPSKKAALRFGFTYEGTFRQHMIIKGENRDTLFFSIIDSEWEKRKTVFDKWFDENNFDENGKQIKRLEDFRL